MEKTFRIAPSSFHAEKKPCKPIRTLSSLFYPARVTAFPKKLLMISSTVLLDFCALWYKAHHLKRRTNMKSSSIGIIGGADGPTAVFVSGDPIGSVLAVVGIAAAIALFAVGIILWVKHKK